MADNPSILQEIDIMRDTYTKYLDRQMQLAGSRSANILRKNKNYATSQLIQSISGSAYSEGDNIVGSFGANTSYAEDVETGKSKTPPTLEAIESWLDRKVQLGHIPLNKWIASKRVVINAGGKTYTQRKNKQSESEKLAKIKYRLALRITERIQTTGILKSVKPYIQPSADILIQKLTNDFPLELN